eukprot:TRINITY_DN13785_c0_g1_i1.p2 TRINITY_DN13785_c0_g1~~TRINITY_DN13785_c0_g1_i1.p2  ORF type:complete len:158 (+),score=69.30 TRINITY_DN13785_c0_g1_i1:82-555(+)
MVRQHSAAATLVAELEVAPQPQGVEGDEYKHVDAAIKVIAKSGLKHHVHALGTVVEGPPADVWKVSRAAFEECLKSGAESEVMHLKVYHGPTSAATLEKSGRRAASKAGSTKKTKQRGRVMKAKTKSKLPEKKKAKKAAGKKAAPKSKGKAKKAMKK